MLVRIPQVVGIGIVHQPTHLTAIQIIAPFAATLVELWAPTLAAITVALWVVHTIYFKRIRVSAVYITTEPMRTAVPGKGKLMYAALNICARFCRPLRSARTTKSSSFLRRRPVIRFQFPVTPIIGMYRFNFKARPSSVATTPTGG